MELARRVTEFVLRRHPDVIAVAVTGSTAKSEDREHSDLEMTAITEREPDTHYYQLIHDGIVVEVAFLSKEEAFKDARKVRVDWAIAADGRISYVAMHDAQGILPQLASLASRPDPAQVPLYLRGALIGMYEDLCNIRNHTAAGESTMARFNAPGIAWSAANFLGLLNAQWFNGTRNFLTKPREFATLPAHFWEDFPLLMVSGGGGDVLPAAERLFAELREEFLARGFGPLEEADLAAGLERGRISKSAA